MRTARSSATQQNSFECTKWRVGTVRVQPSEQPSVHGLAAEALWLVGQPQTRREGASDDTSPTAVGIRQAGGGGDNRAERGPIRKRERITVCLEPLDELRRRLHPAERHSRDLPSKHRIAPEKLAKASSPELADPRVVEAAARVTPGANQRLL